ncbi:MAG: hypothetical protein IPO29_11390 [Anaerolineae bacterium]|nr:hypothetical protein [Anaerolineae bacterium]
MTMMPRRVAASTSMVSTPDPGSADDLQFLARLDHLGVNFGFTAHDQGIVVGDLSEQLGPRQLFVDIHRDRGVGGQQFKSGSRQVFGNQDSEGWHNEWIISTYNCNC